MGAGTDIHDVRPSYGMLGTTFGGNHLACATAIAVLDIIEEETPVENRKTAKAEVNISSTVSKICRK